MSPPKPEERRRRYHKRSRNGCIDCKRKHIRCDEKKPLWYAVLVCIPVRAGVCPPSSSPARREPAAPNLPLPHLRTATYLISLPNAVLTTPVLPYE